jgi:hypothetical protein
MVGTLLPRPANEALLDDREYAGRSEAEVRMRSPTDNATVAIKAV